MESAFFVFFCAFVIRRETKRSIHCGTRRPVCSTWTSAPTSFVFYSFVTFPSLSLLICKWGTITEPSDMKITGVEDFVSATQMLFPRLVWRRHVESFRRTLLPPLLGSHYGRPVESVWLQGKPPASPDFPFHK